MRLRSGLKTSIWKVAKAMGMGEYGMTQDEAGEAPNFKFVLVCTAYLSRPAIRSLVLLSSLIVKRGHNTQSVKMTREGPCMVFLPFHFLPALTRWWSLYDLGL